MEYAYIKDIKSINLVKNLEAKYEKSNIHIVDRNWNSLSIDAFYQRPNH